MFAVDPGYTRTALVEQTAEQAGHDASTAHPPELPAGLIADLVEADIDLTTGRIFKTVEGKHPVLMADGRVPMPEGFELDVSGAA